MKLNSLLLVDDEPDILTVARLSLERVGGFEVWTADSGSAGLELAKAKLPDAILLDVMMPGQDGIETLAQLQAAPETASIPVVFLTAKEQASDRERYLSLGARGVIRKPFDPMQLPDEIRKVLASNAPAE